MRQITDRHDIHHARTAFQCVQMALELFPVFLATPVF